MRSHYKFLQKMLTVVLTTAVLTVLVLPAQAANSKMTDQQITNAVEDEFAVHQAIPENDIDMSTSEGVVTLEGTVNHLLAKERAEKIAETVKGVRSVVNTIQVKPPTDRSDSVVADDVASALLSDPATDSWEIEAQVNDGVVTLTGTVESWAEKQLAARVAKGVRGVTGIKNNIEIDYPAERSDAEIKNGVQEVLRWDTLVDHALIDVKVDNDKVTLSGTVGSAAEKSEATADAWVTGVDSVDASGLKVKRWARDEDLRKDKYVTKGDKAVRQAVEDALLYDPRVSEFDVQVEVDSGFVTLRGKVDNLKAKTAAASVARNTVGVLSVTNQIKVRPAGDLSEDEIAENVRNAIDRDPVLEAYEIDVDVYDNTVYLSGSVTSYYEKGQATDVASRAAGVKEVQNNLTVEAPEPYTYSPYAFDLYPYNDAPWYDYEPAETYETEAEVEWAINDEMEWSPFVDAAEVTVEVNDGKAVLSGTVDTWAERRQAELEAYEGGATSVENNLEIK